MRIYATIYHFILNQNNIYKYLPTYSIDVTDSPMSIQKKGRKVNLLKCEPQLVRYNKFPFTSLKI